jgi:uncharacterized coiled-coil protein SlyX
MQAQEQHLTERIRSLVSVKRTVPHASTSQADNLAGLNDELATLRASHFTTLAQLNTLTRELNELRNTNTALQEENEGWEYLLRERTLNGKVLDGGLLSREGSGEEPPRKHKPRKSELEALDEELEMDELHSDLDAQSPLLDDKHDREFAKDMDGAYVSRTSPTSGHLQPPTRRNGRKAKGLKDSSVKASGLDLAAELGRADVVDDAVDSHGENDNEGEAVTLVLVDS